jgi:sphingomyelin phosphodiesterase
VRNKLESNLGVKLFS